MTNESSLLKQAFLAIQDLEVKLETAQRASAEPIAVIGIGCRFPGGVNDGETFWDLLQNGRDAISVVPGDRWDADAYFDPDPDQPNKMVTRHGGFLDQVDQFDAGFFEIAPREAAAVDPQQRLALEIAWETLENAGYAPANLQGTKTGIFLGMASDDFSQLALKSGDPETLGGHVVLGVARSAAAGRISYVLGLEGPSIALDTACSSSLVAVHIACQSLRSRDCHLALAGGVNLILAPETTALLSRLRMLSPDGKCRTFDERANGFVRGEGCGFVALKRLSQAEADGDRILAVIRSSAVNQDGASSSLTAPNGPSQETLMRHALSNASLSAREISYVEAHGTGTPLGDPIELQAMGAVYGAGRAENKPLLTGSLKTNMGHLESAAGIAGLIKMVLALQHQQIPPHLHLRRPTSHVNWNALRLAVPEVLTNWESEGKSRLAAVSSFGFSGTNAHVILEEAPKDKARTEENGWPVQVLTASAKSESALRMVTAQYRDYLDRHPDADLRDVCFTANTGRSQFAHRVSFMAPDANGMRQELAAFAGAAKPRAKSGTGICFLYTGQGSQYVGMGRELYEGSPVYRRSVEACSSAWEAETGESLLDVLYGTGEGLGEARYAQPALFAVEYGLSELWRSWGIEPSVVLGHSLGEYVAAVVAGIFSLEDGLRLVRARAELMDSLGGRGGKAGAMRTVGGSAERVQELLRGLESEVGIAAINGPESVVISGASGGVAEAVSRLEGAGLRTRALEVTHAFHSPLLEPILEEFEQRASGIQYGVPRLRMVSNLTGKLAEGREMSHAGYWREHMRRTVLFHAGLQTVLHTGCSTFLEIGPQPHLLTLGKLADNRQETLWLPSLRKGRNAWLDLLSGVRALFEDGVDIEWASVHGRAARKISLPTYPFERQRYPLPKVAVRTPDPSLVDSPGRHPLLGARVHSPLEEVQFQSKIGRDQPAYLADHAVNGQPVVPAAAYIEIALSAAKHVGIVRSAVHSVAFLQPCIFDKSRRLQCILKPSDRGRSFTIYSSGVDEESQNDPWALHATGEISDELPSSENLVDKNVRVDLTAIRDRCSRKLGTADFYQTFEERGLGFGPAFRPLLQVFQGSREALIEFEVPSIAIADADRYEVHPVALDACVQAVAAAAMTIEDKSARVCLPAGLDELRILGDCRGLVVGHAELCKVENDLLVANFRGFDRDGLLLLTAEGLILRPLHVPEAGLLHSSFYGVEWLPSKPDAERTQPDAVENWVVFGEDGLSHGLMASLAKEQVACGRIGGNAPAASDLEGYKALLRDIRKKSSTPISDFVYIAPEAQDVLQPGERIATELHSQLLGTCLKLTQALISNDDDAPPHLWIVTKGGQGPTLTNVAHSTLWGFGRAIGLEHPEMRITRIDLEPAMDTGADDLLRIMRAAGEEDEFVLRGKTVLIPRLRKRQLPAEPEHTAEKTNVQLTLVQAGTIDGVQLLPVSRTDPGAGEVEIEVRAAGLNFRDVLTVLGLYKGDASPLGGECAGVVVRVGDGVDRLKAGDEVIALGQGCFGRFLTTRAKLVWPKPKQLSFEAAVTIPVAFLTAKYALEDVARIQPGESVLIHAGAGGVGLAAIQIARRAGAVIFATAGSEEKRAYLRTLGLSRVMDSRSLDFARELREATRGRGVNVVLNSLAGPFIDAGIDVLAPRGRFVELGVADLRSAEWVRTIRPDITYHAIDLAKEIAAATALVQETIATLAEQFQSGELEPLPREIFSLETAHDALRYMAQARHIGRVVVCTQEQRAADIRKDGSYLVTGGMSGLGLKVAEWLSTSGAGEVIVMGRSLPSADATKAFEGMRAEGTAITICQGDVARETEVAAALRARLPLRGVFHCAGILDDGALSEQAWERFESVLSPKVEGACHLHRLTQDSPLDHFVVFSSIAGVFGSPGQSNYASANAFLDALAHLRRSRNLPALSIDWGAWSEIGMAARRGVVERSSNLGLLGISTQDGLAALESLLTHDVGPQAVIAPVNWKRYLSNDLPAGQRQFLSGLQGGYRAIDGEKAQPKHESWLPKLQGVAKSRWKDLLGQLIEEKIRVALRLDRAQSIVPDQPLQELGLDSLLSIELRNALGLSIGHTLPATLLFNHPTLDALSDFLFHELGGAGMTKTAPRIAKPERKNLVEDIEALSDEEVTRMLGEQAMRGVQ